MNLPSDPIILLSYINTQLRDFYSSLDEFCKVSNNNKKYIEEKLNKIDYFYNENANQFQ